MTALKNFLKIYIHLRIPKKFFVFHGLSGVAA